MTAVKKNEVKVDTTSPLYHPDTILTPKQYDLGDTFGVDKAKGRMVWGFERLATTPGQEHTDKHYVFARDVLRTMTGWHVDGADDGLYVSGPTGCGKSTRGYNFFARLGIPVYELTLDEDTEVMDLLGSMSIIEGNTIFMYGPLPQAMGVLGLPGVLILNELPTASPGVLSVIHEVMCGKPLTIASNGGEVVKSLPGFKIFATGNASLVLGDINGLYPGAKPQALSLADRFEVDEADYPEAEVEVQILTLNFPSLPREICEKMVEFANNVRALHMGNSDKENAIEVTMSTRALLRFARKAIYYRNATMEGLNPYEIALKKSVSGHASNETQEALRELAFAKFGASDPTKGV